MEIDKIKRVVLGETSEEEQKEVKEWAAESDERARFLMDAEKFYQSEEIDDGQVADCLRRVWSRLERRARRRRVPWMFRFVSAAACVLVVAGAVFWLWRLERDAVVPARPMAPLSTGVQIVLPDGSRHGVDGRSLAKSEVPGFQMNAEGELRQLEMAEDTTSLVSQVEYNEVIVPRGTTYTLVLADGTEVFLNAETRMKFPERFTGDIREIFLEGEAFFDVERDTNCPFIVRAGGVDVRVLGTEFNVRAYADDNTSATLVSGSVRFTADHDSVILSPGQQCELDAMSRRLSLREADVMSVLAWKSGEFIFRDAPLETIMEEVARWYDVDVVYASDELRSRKIYIYMNRPDTVEEVLDRLVLLGGVDYDMQDNKITLKEKKQ